MPSSRRELLGGLAAGCAGAIAGCSGLADDRREYSPGTDAETEWRFPGRGRQSTAYAPEAVAPRTGVSERWNTEIGWQARRPVVADGRVFVASADGLAAYDLSSGDELWSFAPSDRPAIVAPTVVDGTVYVGFSADETLRALDAETGDEQWSVETRGVVHAEILPAVDRDRIYAGDDTGRVYALTGDGTVVYTYDAVGAVTALAGTRGTVMVGTNGGQVYELYEDGESFYPLWRRRVAGGVRDIAVANGGSVVVSVFGDYVYRLQNGAHAGSDRWRTEFTANHFAVTESTVVGVNLSSLAVLGERNGEKRWTRSGTYNCAPAAAGDRFYVGGEYDDDSKGGYLAAYPLGAGGGLLGGNPERAWKRDLPGVPVGGLTVADGALLAVTEGENGDHRLRAFDPA
ncbi:outer membrane protein assembly factor BamB family protein [Halorussus salinus]|uniref:outer membrane protein assembly factor BamB family protein n=1 Tax=Halorussus salinus TaxID=1364935 RepID=UPI0010920A6B|nr:PQQ-binding-like beta-propeller repeat protein [Halorussus salinus]